MKQKIYMMTIMVFMLFISIIRVDAQVEFKIEIMPDSITYRVSMRPNVTWDPPMNITSSAQVTVKAPVTGFIVGNLMSLTSGVSWSLNSAYYDPDEDPNHDYFSFGLMSLGTPEYNYQAGVEIPLFTFQNLGVCTGGLELMPAGDPFYPPNSEMGNPGNQITTLGGGPINAWIGNYDLNSANCSSVVTTPTCNINNVVSADVSDCDITDGSIVISASSNTFLEYSIDGGATFQVDNIFENLAGGSYNIVIRTSGNTCTATYTGNPVIITEPAPIVLTSTSQNPSDCGVSNGIINLSASGGNGSYEYSINGIDYFSNGMFTNLSVGSYTVSARNTDETCLEEGGTIVLTSPSAPFFGSVVKTNPTACGVSDGKITITGVGGTGSYEYSINGVNFFPSGNFIGLAAGNYPIAIRNADDTCPVSGAIQTLTTQSNLQISVSKTNPSACGSTDGSIQITASGGTGNYLYSINNGATYVASGNFTGLGDGQYDVRVKNANNTCATSSANNPVTLTEPVCPGTCLVDYVLEVLPDGRYQVSVLPHVTWNWPDNITSTAQVTVLAPSGGFVVSELMNLIPGVIFEQNVSYDSPAENPAQDYFIFGLRSLGTPNISYQQGVKTPLFTFRNSGICTDNEVFLLDNNSDPFLPPNLQNANVAQQLSTVGGGGDVAICTSTSGVPCQMPYVNESCLVAYELELLDNGLYQVSLIPDTTWVFPDNFTSTAQVTIVAPTQGLVVNNLTNLITNVVFQQNVTYPSPQENPDKDYFLFGLNSFGTSDIPYEKGQKVPLFTFENGGVCTGDSIYLMPIEGDPFAAPNLQNANVGQQLTVSGFGGADVNLCILTGPVACVPCGVDALDTDGDGICDNEENNTGSDPFDPCDPDIFSPTCNFECEELFYGLDTLIIVGLDNNADVCMQVTPANMNIYDVVVNQQPYTQPVVPCDNDTLVFYSYAFVTGQGNAGPYELQSWTVNGTVFTAIVQDMNELAAVMNQFDPQGNWINNAQFSAVSGGHPNTSYGNMTIRHIQTGISTFIQKNYTYIAYGSVIDLPNSVGGYEIIATNENGCADTLFVEIYNPLADTLTTVFTPDSTSTNFCVDNSEIPAGDFSAAICEMPANGTLINYNNGCFEYIPNEFFVGQEEICVVICSDTSPAVCDTTYIVIDVEQIICEDLFESDTIYALATNGTADLCVSINPAEIGQYEVLVDQIPYNQGYENCDSDTMIFYSYAFVVGQGNLGPYFIEAWTVNGNTFSTTVQDMDELAAWMNQVGVVNNWQNNASFAAISGGAPSNTYGVMKIRHIQTGITTQIQPNFTIISNGSSLNIGGAGSHEVILTNEDTGCSDTAVVILIEPITDTLTVVLEVVEDSIEICLSADELPGNIASVTICEDAENGVLSDFNDACVYYIPDEDFYGEEEFCIIVCSDTPEIGAFCDTTIVTVIVSPPTDTIDVTIDQENPNVVCVDEVLQYPGVIVSSDICGEDLSEVNATVLLDNCFLLEPAADFVGYSEICVLNCYESTVTATLVCDTTYIQVYVPPVIDTVSVTLTDWTSFEVCLDNEINLVGNLTNAEICGENASEVDAEITTSTCVSLQPAVGFQGTTEICVVHCDDNVPAICDTTIVLVTVEVPCPEIFEVDTIYTGSSSLCVPISISQINLYDIIINATNYTAPINGCDEDTLVFYSYAFTQGQGSAGPYEVVSWNVNNTNYSGIVQDMNELAMQMNIWDAGAQWQNNNNSLSLSNTVSGNNYGNLVLKRIASGVQTIMQPNFTQVSQGSEVLLGGAGMYEVEVVESATGCADTLVVFVVETTSDTIAVSITNDIATDPFCITNNNLPGNVTPSLCGSATNGLITYNNQGCLIYTPNTDFVGLEEICVISCSDVPTLEGTPLCDTTLLHIIVLPETQITTVTLPDTDPTIVCLDNELEFPGSIIGSGICGQDLTETTISTDNSTCIAVDMASGFTGVSEVCVLHCYEVSGIAFCDTTIVNLVVLPPLDTINLTITGNQADTLCFSDYDVLQLSGNIATVSICGENVSQLDATIISNDCIALNPVQDFVDITEVCVVHCFDSNPQLCDTTLIIIDVLYPCDEYWSQDTMIVNNSKICAPVSQANFSIFDIILDGQNYSLPPDFCNEDSLVYYTYSFTVGAGMSGPYQVSWSINGQAFNGSVQNMDELAAMMSFWDSDANWQNDPATASIRREDVNADFGTMIITHILTGVPAFLNPNFTSVALGTCVELGDAGWHQVEIINTENGCTDIIDIFYYDTTTDTLIVQTDANTPTNPPICLDTTGLPGNIVSVEICNAPTFGTIVIDNTCLTYHPEDFYSGTDQFCIVICDDTPAPYGQLCDTTYISVQVAPFDCDSLFTSSVIVINETSGTGFGSLCTGIGSDDYGIYQILVNNAPYAGTNTGCDLDTLTYYSYSFTIGAGQSGPYELSAWQVNGSVFNGVVNDMTELANLMNNFDPGGNWTNNPTSLSISGGNPATTYGDMVITHVNTAIPSVLSANQTSIANSVAISLPLGTNTVQFINTINGCVEEIEVQVNAIPSGVLVHARVFLQAAFNQNTGLMHDNLRTTDNIPLVEPYTDFNPIPGIYRFNHVNGGGEITTSSILSIQGPDAIVDWVFLELRSAVDNQEVIASRSALLQRDGDIVDIDGISPVLFDAPDGEYHLAVRHRNHLGVMSLNTYTLSAISTAVDFTSPNTATYGQHAMKPMASGHQVMWGGDANGDGLLIFQGANNDPDAIFFDILLSPGNSNFDQNFLYYGYHGTDANMDGKTVFQGNNNDIDFLIFFNVLQHPNSGFVINFVVTEQLP